MSQDRLLIFGRRPAAGRVKTHLSPPLPPDEAAAVYEACLMDVVALAAGERAQVEIWFDAGAAPDRALEYFARVFPLVSAVPQATGHLGTRVEDAFDRTFASGAERAIIMRSDAATLPASCLHAAFDYLLEPAGPQLVLGPTPEGGYYLVGLRRTAWPAAAVLFRSIPWSHPSVLRITGERAAAAGLSLRLLPGWYDIVRPEDLARARADTAPESHLGRWLDGPEGERYIPRA